MEGVGRCCRDELLSRAPHQAESCDGGVVGTYHMLQWITALGRPFSCTRAAEISSGILPLSPSLLTLTIIMANP